MKVELHERIENDHTYHTPDVDDIPKFAEIRRHARLLAHTMVDTCPLGRELSTALTNLETAVFHANAAIARAGTAEDFK